MGGWKVSGTSYVVAVGNAKRLIITRINSCNETLNIAIHAHIHGRASWPCMILKWRVITHTAVSLGRVAIWSYNISYARLPFDNTRSCLFTVCLSDFSCFRHTVVSLGRVSFWFPLFPTHGRVSWPCVLLSSFLCISLCNNDQISKHCVFSPWISCFHTWYWNIHLLSIKILIKTT